LKCFAIFFKTGKLTYHIDTDISLAGIITGHLLSYDVTNCVHQNFFFQSSLMILSNSVSMEVASVNSCFQVQPFSATILGAVGQAFNKDISVPCSVSLF